MNTTSIDAPRFKPLPESEMTEAQRNAARELASSPRGKMNADGPNALLLRSPDLMSRTQKVGEFLRYKSTLPARLNEFAICITARQWDANVEWMAHHPLALKAGLNPAVAALHPLAGAATVDVDFVVAPLLAQPRAMRQVGRFTTTELQGHRMLLGVETQMPRHIAMNQCARGDHLGV